MLISIQFINLIITSPHKLLLLLFTWQVPFQITAIPLTLSDSLLQIGKQLSSNLCQECPLIGYLLVLVHAFGLGCHLLKEGAYY